MTDLAAGDRLPEIVVPPPGPRSRALADRLRRHESPNITLLTDEFPIFWERALGANVLDVDGNVYLDLTGAFGVVAAGHRHPAVVRAVRDQLDRLVQGLGDVHPPEIKVRTLERLAEIAPGPLSQSILGSTGSDAVEAALKTARIASGAPGVVAFTGAYHGLGYGALCVTDRERFRGPFRDQLGIPVLRAPFPDPYRPPPTLRGVTDLAGSALEQLETALAAHEGPRVGAVIVEPILGRGGGVVPPDGFLTGLRELCDLHGMLLIFDEILTGLGRTGRWFACEHEDVVPDLLCTGKALGGALPFSACIGRPEIMSAWPTSEGEAIHTSTFLGHPLSCAAALAALDTIEDGLIARAERLGAGTHARLEALAERCPGIGDVRGRGLLLALELVADGESRRPDPERTRAVVVAALRRGILLLSAGPRGNVISLTPPLTISQRQLDFSLEVLEDCLTEA